MLNNHLNKEISNIKKDNKFLKNKIINKDINLSEKKISTKKVDINILYNKYNILPKENKNFKTDKVKFVNKIKLNFDKNSINYINEKKDKNKNDQIESL